MPVQKHRHFYPSIFTFYFHITLAIIIHSMHVRLLSIVASLPSVAPSTIVCIISYSFTFSESIPNAHAGWLLNESSDNCTLTWITIFSIQQVDGFNEKSVEFRKRALICIYLLHSIIWLGKSVRNEARETKRNKKIKKSADIFPHSYHGFRLEKINQKDMIDFAFPFNLSSWKNRPRKKKHEMRFVHLHRRKSPKKDWSPLKRFVFFFVLRRNWENTNICEPSTGSGTNQCKNIEQNVFKSIRHRQITNHSSWKKGT